jgi:CHASE2 domain-containing sensor protein
MRTTGNAEAQRGSRIGKSVVIQPGSGDLHAGFPKVTAQLWAANGLHPEQFIGSLPAAPYLIEDYNHWQAAHQYLCDRVTFDLRTYPQPHPSSLEDDELEIDEGGITNVSQVSFDDLCQQLNDSINLWLQSRGFLNIDQKLRSQLSPNEEIRVIFETNDQLLRRIPWHRWEFFRDYPKAEVALSLPEYKYRSRSTKTRRQKARILAILGNSKGIDLEAETQFLEGLKDAETQFLVSPSRQEFNQQLWADPGWDLLFFAGHSQTEGETGRIYINENPFNNSLTIEQFGEALAAAIENGLKLAIFNSCDGLGLANALGKLDIPQAIVMREPVPNRVAQEFFKYFLEAFASKQLPLYLAVRQARRRLQGLEDEFPGASWLPVLCQNPAAEPSRWQEWCAAAATNKTRRMSGSLLGDRRWQTVFLTSAIITVLIMGGRYLGALQHWELQAFDHLMRLRPAEPPDQRLLIVTVTEEDFQLPQQAQRKGSLSDLALAQLLAKLTPLKPRAIGLDIYHDFPVDANQSDLANYLQGNDNFFAICKVSDRQANYPGIAPLPKLPETQQGFSDVVTDADDVLRRHLLAMNVAPASPCMTPYALSTQLALHYLAAAGISAHYTPQGNLQLGELVLPRLHNHMGGYQQADTLGYQILLNYRSTHDALSPAPTVTLKDVLTGKINPGDVKDRIVLIGVTAPSAADYLSTPYSYQKTAGVFLQAQMVSQILSAVQDDRHLLSVWSIWQELLWVWIWAGVGGGLAWGCRLTLQLVLLEVAAFGVLSILCFCLLTQSTWVPLVPSILALGLTGGAIAYLTSTDKTSSDQ